MSDLLNQLLAQTAASDKQRQEVSAMQLAADEQKRMSVASKTEAKKQQVQANSVNPTTDSVAYSAAVSLLSGYGKDSRTAQEQVVLNNPYDNSNLGFEEATRLFNARNRNVSAAIADTSAQRSGLSAIGDTTLDVARGAANMVSGPVALGAGLVNDNAGAALSQFIANTNAGVDSLQSDSLNSRRKFNATANQLDSRDNEAKYQQDIANGESDTLATLRREGRNALGAISIGGSDAQTLLSNTAQGVGSVLPVGTAASLIGKAAGLAGKAGAVVANNATPLAVGAMGGGGAYQGTVSKIMEMPDAELAKVSPEFVSLVQSGMSPQDAKVKLANDAGKTAAMVAAPASFLLGKFMPEFESLKLSKLPNASTALKAIPKEGLEEGVESASGNFGQNLGIQQNVNPNQSLTDGLGKDVGEGVLSGLTTATALSSPKLASSAVLTTANATIGALVKRADKLLEKAEANSPVHLNNTNRISEEVSKVTPAVVTSLEEQKSTATPELAAKIDTLITAINSISGYDPADYTELPDTVQKALSTSKTKVEALLNLKKVAEDSNFSLEERNAAGTNLIEELDAMHSFLEGNVDAIASLKENEPVRETINMMQRVAANVLGSPEFIKGAKAVADQLVAKHASNSPLVALSNLDSVEGKQAAKEVAAIAQYAPEKSNKEAIALILEHNTAGLSKKQEASLRSAYTILETFSKNNPQGTLLSSIEDVTGEAVTNDKKGKKGDSALSYLNSITDAIASGDTASAASMLGSLGDFAQHFQNKAAALNIAAGKPTTLVKYDKLLPDGSWSKAGGTVGIHNTEGSLATVTRIMREAETIGLMFNSLANQYPKLGIKPIALTQADSVFLDQNNDGIIDAGALGRNLQWAKPAPQQAESVEQPATPANEEKPQPAASEQKTEPVSVGSKEESAPVSRISTEQASRLSDAGLDDRIARIEDKVDNSTVTEEDKATLTVLNTERSNRIEQDKKLADKAKEDAKSKSEAAKQKLAELRDKYISLRKEKDTIAKEDAQGKKKNKDALNSVDKEMADVVSSAEFTFDNAKEELNYLSNLPPSTLRNRPDLVKRLWLLKKENGLLSKAFSAFGDLMSTAGNLLINGTTVYSGENSAKQNRLISLVSTPVQEFLEYFKEQVGTASSDERKIDANTLSAYIDNNVANIKRVLNEKVRAEFVKDKKPTTTLIQLLQANPVDHLRQFKKLVHRFPRYRIFSILSPQENSSIPVLNEKMVELAALAFTQWELNRDNYKGKVDAKDVASLYGIDEMFVTEAMVAELQESTTYLEIENTLGPIILKYWGLVPKSDMPVGYHEGVAKSVALEIVKALLDSNSSRLTSRTFDMTPEKTIKLISFNPLPDNVSKANGTFANIIEKAAFVEPELPYYFNKDDVPVSTTVLRSPHQKLTQQQRDALKAEQSTPFFLNLLSYQLYNAIGLDNLYALRNLPTSAEEKLLNENTLKTVVGKKKGIAAAHEKMQAMYREIKAQAGDGDIESVALYNKYEIISTGRMQMSGAQNVQANKQMRHVLLSTKDTVDLTDEKMLSNFKLAVAQGLGIKVHTMFRSAMVKALDKKLDTLVGKRIMSDLQAWSANPNTSIDYIISDLKEFFGNGFTDAGLYALLEYSRYLAADKEGLKQFTTSIYVEADGVTNGPAAAMYMMGAVGRISKKWLANMARTGYFISSSNQSDEENRITLNKARTEDSSDLYGVTGLAVPKFIKQMLDSTTPGAEKMAKATLTLITSLVPGVEGINGNITRIDRSVTKNPLTTAMYGSGTESTAINILKDALDNFYAKLSNVALQLNNPENTYTEAQLLDIEFNGNFNKLMKAFNEASQGKLLYSKKKEIWYSKDIAVDTVIAGNKLSNYSVTPEAIDNLVNNFVATFAAPMKAAIKEETGTTVDSSRKIITITQTPTVLMEREFMRMYNEAVENNIKNKEDYQKSDGLSIDELRSIESRMRKLFPFIQTEIQSFDVSNTKRLPLEQYSIGATLDEVTKVNPSVNVPQSVGVAGIPYLIIGLGDARMMQYMAADSNGPTGTLKIYDGMHMKLSSLDEDSLAANKAVWDAWQGNPFEVMEASFVSFIKNYDWQNIIKAIQENKEPNIKKIGEALGVNYDEYGNVLGDVPDSIAFFLESAYNSMLHTAAGIAATHEVLNTYQASIDQMASVGASYLHNPNGKFIDSSEEGIEAINQEIAGKAKELYRKKLRTGLKINTLIKVTELKEKDIIASELDQQVTVRDYLKSVKLKGASADLIKSIIQVAGDVLVVKGDADFIRQESKYNFSSGTNAFYNTANNTIYIIDGRADSNETILHEAIHAATVSIISNHYANPSANPEVAAVISRLEKLMDRFINETEKTKSEGASFARIAVFNADTQTKKLAEFLAWGMSNPGTKNVLSKLASTVREYVFRLLNVVGIKVPTNLYQELVFESLSLIDIGSGAQSTENLVLHHSTSSLPGNDERINQVNSFFTSVYAKHMQNSMINGLHNLPASPIYTNNPAEFTVAQQLADSAESLIDAYFPGMTPAQLSAAGSVVRTLATTKQLDGSSLSEIDKIYTQFAKNLTVADLLTVPEQQATQADLAQAQDMFNVLVGKFHTNRDIKDRSQLLPIFMALALTNDHVRSVLVKKQVQAGSKLNKDSLDTVLQSAGTLALEKLDSILTAPVASKNMQQAIDSLYNSLVKSTEDSLNVIDSVSAKTGSVIDGLNDKVLLAVKTASDLLEKAGNNLETSNNKLVSTAGSAVSLLGKSLVDSKAEGIAEGLTAASNSTDAFKPLRELIVDFIGRTESNKLIYDMVKFVRSMVQQDRSHYREHLPTVFADKFKTMPSKEQWTHLFNGLGKTDFAALVNQLGVKTAMTVLADPKEIDSRIRSLESDLRTSVPKVWPSVQAKAEQLAKFMNTGVPGSMLLRNAKAISKLYGGNVEKIDLLVSLYALRSLDLPTRNTISSLVQTEAPAIEFIGSYLGGLSKDEEHSSDNVAINGYKGYIPSLPSESAHLIVADDTRYVELVSKSYVRLGDYSGSSAEGNSAKGYYYLKAPHRAAFSQGLMQNIHQTANGIDVRTKLTVNGTAGAITNPREVARITRRMSLEQDNAENLMPVFEADGSIIAYERAMNPAIAVKLEKDTHLAKMMGVWRGRQVEEAKAQEVNKALINNLKETYDNAKSKAGFVNLFDSTDPVHQDALRLMPPAARQQIERLFGKNTFMVQRSMINNAIGYRTPSIGDAWTGVSNWSDEALDTAKKIAISVFGNKAYEYLVNAEQMLKNFIQDAKLIIVVKSIVVPVGNIVSNILQLMARGVPLRAIRKGIPAKLSEINFYTKQRVRKLNAEAELLSVKGDIIAEKKLINELDTIEDSFRRLSIWPLIEAGEFSAISDAGISRDDILLSEGRLHAYIEKLVNKLPPGMQTVGKYGLVTKDTALFQGMQKAVEYGDFLAKALRYDHLISQGKSEKDALAGITEEFVNYDLLMGRFREYGENIGLWWFTAFKVRSLKVAASMIRNNPVHTLLSSFAPVPSAVGAGSPITDNVLAKALGGNLGYSLGWGQALRAPALNPWWNLTH